MVFAGKRRLTYHDAIIPEVVAYLYFGTVDEGRGMCFSGEVKVVFQGRVHITWHEPCLYF